MPQTMSRETFRRWAEQQPRRYGRVDGEPVAMSPESYAHASLKSRVWLALREAIRAAGVPCEALPGGMTVEIDDSTDYEPDASVHCGQAIPPDSVAIPSPVIVVEVLSPSTQSVDTGGKVADYFRVASIHHYLIVLTRRQQIIHHRRDGDGIATRIVTTGTLALNPPGLVLDVAAVYAG